MPPKLKIALWGLIAVLIILGSVAVGIWSATIKVETDYRVIETAPAGEDLTTEELIQQAWCDGYQTAKYRYLEEDDPWES